MASPTQLVKCLAETLGVAEATCDSTWKALRSNNLVVNSGRGKRGTRVSAQDCATFLLAVCGADHVKDSVVAAELYGNCTVDPGDDQHPPYRNFAPLAKLGPRHTLKVALTAIIDAYTQDAIPPTEVRMQRPDGRAGPKSLEPTRVSLTLTIPPPSHPAHLGVNSKFIIEYHRRRSAQEMFGGLFEGEKSRIATVGDLQIEKRVSSATFAALGKLLREK